MKILIGIGLGGFFGSIARYLITDYVSRHTTISFPYGTLIVNVVGSFIIGVLMLVSFKTFLTTDTVRMVVGVGFLGALTTYSTFSYETLQLLQKGNWNLALMNIGLNVFGCLLAVALGWAIVSLLTGKTL